jgi:hypothetical protein
MPEPRDITTKHDRVLGLKRLTDGEKTWTEVSGEPGSVLYLRAVSRNHQQEGYKSSARKLHDEANALEITTLREMLTETETDRDALVGSVCRMAGVRPKDVYKWLDERRAKCSSTSGELPTASAPTGT